MLRKNKKQKKFILTAAVVVVTAAAFGLFYYRNSRTNSITPPNSVAPATEQEKIETEQNKERIAAENENRKDENFSQNGEQSANKNTGTVTVTFSGQYGEKVEVGAFVANIFEDGGVCESTFTNGTATLTKQSAAFKDVGHTSCTPLSIDKSEFSQSGQWKLIVKYNSPRTSGQSTERIVEVK